MTGEQPHQFLAGVPGGPHHGHLGGAEINAELGGVALHLLGQVQGLFACAEFRYLP